MNTCLMPSIFAAISPALSIFRDSSLPVGSPILVVPPPIRAIGLWPVFCSQRNIMICTNEPACRLVAVASNPM